MQTAPGLRRKTGPPDVLRALPVVPHRNLPAARARAPQAAECPSTSSASFAALELTQRRRATRFGRSALLAVLFALDRSSLPPVRGCPVFVPRASGSPRSSFTRLDVATATWAGYSVELNRPRNCHACRLAVTDGDEVGPPTRARPRPCRSCRRRRTWTSQVS